MESILEENRPDIVGITEKRLDIQEEINLKGYWIIRNDRNREGGEVMIAVRRDLEHVIMEVNQESSFEQSIWILPGNKEKIKIGIIYAA